MHLVTVLLTDPEQRASLAAARALSAAGFRVVTLGASRGLAGLSRAVARAHVAPADTFTDQQSFIRGAADVVARESVAALVPVTDRASRLLLGQDAALGCPVVGPTAEAYARASNKESLLAQAIGCGIRVPRQVVLASPADVLPRGTFPDSAPLVVKPARSVVVDGGVTVSTSVRHAANDAALEEVRVLYPAAAYPLLIQERIIGDGVGVFLLREQGRTLLSFGHRRLREKPPSGGVSTYREAIVPPAALLQQCEALLDRVGYAGPAMVEFKQDVASGEHVLMEINARLWGSLQLAVDAGVNFPAAMVSHALGQRFQSAAGFTPGIRSVWELGEVDHALALFRRTREELHAPPGMHVGILAALRSLLDHRWSDRPEVFRFTDPMPFVAELLRWLRIIRR